MKLKIMTLKSRACGKLSFVSSRAQQFMDNIGGAACSNNIVQPVTFNKNGHFYVMCSLIVVLVIFSYTGNFYI